MDTPASPTDSLSLHDALPIWRLRLRGIRQSHQPVHVEPSTWSIPGWYCSPVVVAGLPMRRVGREVWRPAHDLDRKSTRLNSSHMSISYAVSCLKKKIATPSQV